MLINNESFLTQHYLEGKKMKMSKIVIGLLLIISLNNSYANTDIAEAQQSVINKMTIRDSRWVEVDEWGIEKKPNGRGFNVTQKIADHCNGKVACSFFPNIDWLGDPAPGVRKGLFVFGTCNSNARLHVVGRMENSIIPMLLICAP